MATPLEEEESLLPPSAHSLDYYIDQLNQVMPNIDNTVRLVDEVFYSEHLSTRDIRDFLDVLTLDLLFVRPITRDEISSHVYSLIYAREDESRNKLDEATAIWRGFTKSRYRWCPFHKMTCLVIHIISYFCSAFSFVYTREAAVIFGPRIEDPILKSMIIMYGFLIGFITWLVIGCMSIGYQKLTTWRWKGTLDRSISAAFKILFPIIAVVFSVSFDAFDDIYTFLMLVCAIIFVATGIGLVSVTDDMGAIACVTTVALMILTRLPNSATLKYIAAIVIGLTQDFVSPCIKYVSKLWFVRHHAIWFRTHFSFFGGGSMSFEEEAAEFATRKARYIARQNDPVPMVVRLAEMI